MSRRARARAHHPRRAERVAAVNNFEIAASRAAWLSMSDVQGQTLNLRHALDEYLKGRDCAQHWASLADACNMAETLQAMGNSAGADAEQVVSDAQAVLADAHRRRAERGTWALYADEIDKLRWLIQLHEHQLTHCTYGDLGLALDRTKERMAQALAGNAAPGTVVLVGQMGRSPLDAMMGSAAA